MNILNFQVFVEMVKWNPAYTLAGKHTVKVKRYTQGFIYKWELLKVSKNQREQLALKDGM